MTFKKCTEVLHCQASNVTSNCSKHYFSWSAKICQTQSTAHPTRGYLWKPTGEQGLSLFSFYNSRIFCNIPTKRSHKGLCPQYCCSLPYRNNSYEVRYKSLSSSKDYLHEVLEHHYFSITDWELYLARIRGFSRLIL